MNLRKWRVISVGPNSTPSWEKRFFRRRSALRYAVEMNRYDRGNGRIYTPQHVSATREEADREVYGGPQHPFERFL